MQSVFSQKLRNSRKCRSNPCDKYVANISMKLLSKLFKPRPVDPCPYGWRDVDQSAIRVPDVGPTYWLCWSEGNGVERYPLDAVRILLNGSMIDGVDALVLRDRKNGGYVETTSGEIYRGDVRVLVREGVKQVPAPYPRLIGW